LLTGDTSAVPARFSNAAGVRTLNKPVDSLCLVSLMDELLQAEQMPCAAHASTPYRPRALRGPSDSSCTADPL
jgi:hypothetical protein